MLTADLHLTAPCCVTFTDGIKVVPDITLLKFDPLLTNAENDHCLAPQILF